MAHRVSRCWDKEDTSVLGYRLRSWKRACRWSIHLNQVRLEPYRPALGQRATDEFSGVIVMEMGQNDRPNVTGGIEVHSLRALKRNIVDRSVSADAAATLFLSLLLGNVVQSALLRNNPTRKLAKGVAGLVPITHANRSELPKSISAKTDRASRSSEKHITKPRKRPVGDLGKPN